MQVALLTTFKASRKDPLGESLERIHAAFLAAGEGEPTIRFRLSDSPVAGPASIVDRAIKRYPELARFLLSAAPAPNTLAMRQLGNFPGCPVEDAVPFATLAAIAHGVPRSFPFHAIGIDFHSPAFGGALSLNTATGALTPGIKAGDSWWVSGRTRTLLAVTAVAGEVKAKKLPPLPPAVEAIFAACGKIKNTVQVPLVTAAPAANAVRDLVASYRARLAEIVDRAALPHDLPPAADIRMESVGLTSGPKKPALEKAFGPLGYTCRGESGAFTLRRRTPANHTIEIALDVGTWSNSLTGSYHVYGLGFSAMMPLPVSARNLTPAQYPIGDSARWERIVDNLAALTRALDRDFAPAIEAAAGPSPEWHRPES